MNTHRVQGFTLIELMIVVVIIAILAVIAYPSYDSFIRKTRMEEAKASIMQTVRDMERHYSKNRSFASAPDPADTEFFNIAFASGSPGPDKYEIIASPISRTNPNERKIIYYNSIGIISRCDSGPTNCEPY